MIGELWQFLIASAVGAAAIVLWVLLVYLPRREWDGEGNDGTEKLPTNATDKDR